MSKKDSKQIVETTEVKFDKDVYEYFDNFGTIIKVNSKKVAGNGWNIRKQSDKFNSLSNFAIIPNKNLLIIDVDNKKGGTGSKSFRKLCNILKIDEPSPTVTTPSGAYHYYFISDNELKLPNNLKRTIKVLPDIEFITGSTSGYVLLPSNKSIQSFDNDGNKKIGNYDETGDIIYEEDNSDTFLPNRLYKSVFNKDVIKKMSDKASEKKAKRDIKKDDDEDDNDFVTIDDVESLLSYLDGSDYHEWVTIGGHVKKALGEKGKKLFIEWSLDSDNAGTRSKIAKKWNDLPTADGKGIGSLVYLAKEEKMSRLRVAKDIKNMVELIESYPKLSEGFTKDELNEFINSKKELKAYYNKQHRNKTVFPNMSMKYKDYFLDKIKVGKEFVENTIKHDKQIDMISHIVRHVKYINNKLAILNYENRTINILKNTNHLGNLVDFLAINFNEDMYHIQGQVGFKIKELVRDLSMGSADYSLIESADITKEGFEIDNEKLIITNWSRIIPQKFETIDIDADEEYKIISDYNKHWYGYDMTLLKWAIGGKYMTNKKEVNIAVLANSNFGKGFHFSILEDIGIAKINKIKDYCINGDKANGRPMSDYTNLHCHIFDETAYMPRTFYEIKNSIIFRALYQLPVNIEVGSGVFLDADGGSFNSDTMDEQVTNRVNILDFRIDKKRKVTKLYGFEKYGKELYYAFIYNYYSKEIIKYINELEKMTQIERIQSFGVYDNFLKNLTLLENGKNVTVKKEVVSFYESVDNTLREIINNMDILNNKGKDILLEYCTYHEKTNSLLIRNASLHLPILLSMVNHDLESEFKFKKLKTLVHHIDRIGDSKTYRDGSKSYTATPISLDGMEVDEELLDHIR